MLQASRDKRPSQGSEDAHVGEKLPPEDLGDARLHNGSSRLFLYGPAEKGYTA